MNNEQQYMQRALQLAEYGRGSVSPNPMVGCVITCHDRIIGEGWHRRYGQAHAEVEAVRDALARGNEPLLPQATVYVTLEPCSHVGKTPPCADLLVEKKVKRVVVCNDDPNPLVAGKGLQRLREAGIDVQSGLLAEQGRELNRRFFTFFEQKRPYVILKWAETADGFIGGTDRKPVAISGEYSGVRVHRWRSEEDAILVGAATALADNPRLNVRHWAGYNPVRIVLDRQLRLPATLHLFDQSQPTIIYNHLRSTPPEAFPVRYPQEGVNKVAYAQYPPGGEEISEILTDLYHRKIQSVLVEGGAAVLTAFLESGLWDEIRRCQSTLRLGNGVKAPAPQGVLSGSEKVQQDLWTYYRNA
ncbi:bifunctional diaminohydroxyphosphoribosylaminopyrimidine deaminase/5-amino-6-(5-phosphoribosylamino)uracil reductase RibD [Telluribacter sp.]|jgi:diaminohydroxyphosphoribosylaminopyrimidine deaminase/5-amino-6-(5-phosphoribosylamino)uracil reductase|uniref:bifunctional diaminohydroxyphosphoribosylaminopyrimidine deaminase/5-amino-6-(5-phosphoribosylamino)uracil reductase RibD n=1 Tax=Telluribacter sp. TaxID=1978767 RepID=UPI002E0E9B3E|nr:bifunctional diaminohydroxyphosphoribosylaminopyrimidine deaminase/5-amino-6-(5-phosphoribosylamino)uracil reductase RibD [Telluribacter sp.]